MNHIKSIQRIGQRVGLMKFEGIVRLRVNIDTHHLKACAMVTHGAATGTTEEVQEAIC
jgi:hypothetical protein